LCDERERAVTIGADPGTLAIVILPHEKGDLTFKVCLMELDRDGEIDWDARKFILTRTAGLDGAKNYAMSLSDHVEDESPASSVGQVRKAVERGRVSAESGLLHRVQAYARRHHRSVYGLQPCGLTGVSRKNSRTSAAALLATT
jgi:hypothetical protein